MGMSVEVGAYTFGIYPRPERLIAATRRLDPRLNEITLKETKRIISLQIKSGLTVVSDPLLDWDDMLRWFAIEWEGLRVDGLSRYFEHNVFYRVPVVEGRIKVKDSALVKHLRLGVLGGSGRSLLIEVPDPVTFALMVRDRFYNSLRELCLSIAKALNEELKEAFSRAKPSLVVVKAPMLPYVGGDTLSLVDEAAGILLDGVGATSILHMYFKAPVKPFSRLVRGKLAYDGFGLEITRSNEARDLARALESSGYRGSVITLGVINPHDTRMEDARRLVKDLTPVAGVLKRLGVPTVYVSNGSDLEFLPYRFATKKVRKLGIVRRWLAKEW